MNRRIVQALVLFAIGALAAGCGDSRAAAPPPAAPVKVEPVI